jgi:hypothetical protein
MKKGSIAIGDAVVLSDGRRGQVTLAARSGAWLLIRLKTSPAGPDNGPEYLMCAPHEARRINAWWNVPAKRTAFTDTRRAA